MKKIIQLITLSGFLSCSAGTAEGGQIPNFVGPDTLPAGEAAVAQGGFQFLTTVDYPPFSFVDASGRLSGFSVYLAKAICTELKTANCTVQALPWPEIEPALAKGQGNAALSGMASTPENRKALSFSYAFMRFPARFVGLSKADLKPDFAKGLPGTRIAVIAGSAHELMVRAFFPDAAVTGFATQDQMLAELKAGKSDLIFGDALQLSFVLDSQLAGGCCAFSGGPYYSETFLGEGMKIAVPSKRTDLLRQINAALSALQRKGVVDELYLRFFPRSFY